MDRLWSPWRYRYVTKATPESPCIFCEKAPLTDDEANLVVFRARHNFGLLNLYPYTNGHMMIAPYEHVANLASASEEAVIEMARLARLAESVIQELYRPHGLNIGLNIGEAAGAGVAGHIHLHIVPRWRGDANFMTIVGETRVMPEDLEVTWQRIRKGFEGKVSAD